MCEECDFWLWFAGGILVVAFIVSIVAAELIDGDGSWHDNH